MMPPGAGGDWLPSDRLVYAVGDIHGRADLLDRLIDRIRRDCESRDVRDQPPLLVFLGDYVDRGAESRRVIDRMLELAGEATFECRFLAGNHEDTMLDFLDGKILGSGWAAHGGDATLRAYGAPVPFATAPAEAWSEAQLKFAAAVPPEHVSFLRNLELMVTAGPLVFVHAGIRPGVPLDRQERRDLLWIRSHFLEHPCATDRLIVHGHTPAESVYGAPGRLCLDTAAYLTGRLTAAVFDSGGIELIDTFTVRASPLESTVLTG